MNFFVRAKGQEWNVCNLEKIRGMEYFIFYLTKQKQLCFFGNCEKGLKMSKTLLLFLYLI